MAKKVLIVSASPRKGGNSELLAEEFARGAAETGAQVETIRLRDMELNFCRGCLACQTTCRCVISDGASEALDRVRHADVLVFATPIYYYAVCGQLKTFLDRMNPLFAAGHDFRQVYLLASSADSESTAMDGAVKDLEGWISCFDGAELSGVVRGTGADKLGEIKTTNPAALAEAYEMGRRVIEAAAESVV